MVRKRIYYIDDLSTILGKSVAAIHGHIARKQYDAVPPPMKVGRRLAWLVESVDDWIDAKAAQAATQAEEYTTAMRTPARRRGRPTKAEARARDRFGNLQS
jgi:hypothetical protein